MKIHTVKVIHFKYIHLFFKYKFLNNSEFVREVIVMYWQQTTITKQQHNYITSIIQKILPKTNKETFKILWYGNT